MSAGNSSNTVFTAIPVGEDFLMSFSTERFFHNINTADISNVIFKLYDARIIGTVSSPEPSAIIETVDKTSSPDRFNITSTQMSVSVTSSSLDTYESTKTGVSSSIFRGELYGYAEVVVAGEETGDITRLQATGIRSASTARAVEIEEIYWDGYFDSTGVSPIRAKLVVVGTLTP